MAKNTAAAAALKDPSKKGKKGKKFVEAKDAALELANSIADGQEDKTNARIARIHETKTHSAPNGERKTKSASRQKLKETKAVLLAKRAQLKREKAKLRKEKAQGTSPKSGKVQRGEEKPGRKRVSFA